MGIHADFSDEDFTVIDVENSVRNPSWQTECRLCTKKMIKSAVEINKDFCGGCATDFSIQNIYTSKVPLLFLLLSIFTLLSVDRLHWILRDLKNYGVGIRVTTTTY